MNRAKAGRWVRPLAEGDREPARIATSDEAPGDPVAEPVVGRKGESEVLLALDPFWTRGIVLPVRQSSPSEELRQPGRS